mmetsp:Transcript_61168/g.144529  ORF Transcript_61168/g.144529 Transcript_61168/m.144529 type:complete len:293 (+) Transcript_61168:1640-2518(+)
MPPTNAAFARPNCNSASWGCFGWGTRWVAMRSVWCPGSTTRRTHSSASPRRLRTSGIGKDSRVCRRGCSSMRCYPPPSGCSVAHPGACSGRAPRISPQRLRSNGRPGGAPRAFYSATRPCRRSAPSTALPARPTSGTSPMITSSALPGPSTRWRWNSAMRRCRGTPWRLQTWAWIASNISGRSAVNSGFSSGLGCWHRSRPRRLASRLPSAPLSPPAPPGVAPQPRPGRLADVHARVMTAGQHDRHADASRSPIRSRSRRRRANAVCAYGLDFGPAPGHAGLPGQGIARLPP